VPDPAAAITPVSTFIKSISILFKKSGQEIRFYRRGDSLGKIALGFAVTQARNYKRGPSPRTSRFEEKVKFVVGWVRVVVGQ
jgi:hypothetical protein